MKLSQAAIDRPRVILVITSLLMIMALFAALRIPVQRTPAINTAIVMVAIPFPGSQPTDADEQITLKVEKALKRLNNVDFVSSTSLRGSSVTQIVFRDGVNSKQARADVDHLINQIRGQLPAGREVVPSVTEIDFESAPIMLVTITGPDGYDERQLKQVAEDVQNDLETLRGVANTQLFGGREREIHVNFSPDLLSQYGVSFEELRSALQAFHSELPGGSLNSGEFDLQVRVESKFRNVDDIREAVVAERQGRLIRVADVATVEDTYRRLMNFAQLDGRTGATIIVNKEANINSLATAQAIKDRVAELGEQYPHLTFSTTRDISADIRQMVEVLGSSAVFGGMVVLVILAWSMGLRTSLLVLVAIPVSSAVALIFLYATGVAISNMVLFSYILALGMVVDGAIIVAENIHRHIELGKDPVDAAKIGIDEVGIPVIAADLTTVAAFLPMLLVGGIMGDFMGVMPKTVSLALLGSVIVDHFLLPVVAARVYKKQDPVVHAVEEKPRRPVIRLYARMLNYSLEHSWVVLVSSGLAIVWAGTMLYYGFIGFTFFPPSDRGQFEVSYELPLGYSIEQTAEAARRIVEPVMELDETGELRHIVTAVGAASALATRLESDPAMGPEFGKIMVELAPARSRQRHEAEIIAELREKIKPLPGMKYRIDTINEGPPGGSPVAIRITGKNLDRLGMLADLLVTKLSHTPGAVQPRMDYRPDTPELVIEPRPGVVGLYGMTERTVNNAIATAVLGDSSIELALDDEDITLRLQAMNDYQQFPGDVRRLMITGPTGRKATIGELTDMTFTTGLFSVNRYDGDLSVTISSDIDSHAGVIPDDVFRVLRNEILPALGFQPVSGNSMAFLGQTGTYAEGTRAVFTGENEERNKGFADLFTSMTVAVVLIAGILVVQFNSFRQALIVMATVPLSFVGVIFGLWISNFDFSLAAFIGLVSLTGIVVNDAIVLVDFANQERKRGMPVRAALLEAGQNRFRAVMLTSATTAGGLLPMYLNLSGGAEFWQPLTGAIIYGLAFATLLTLVVIPVVYSLAYRRVENMTQHASVMGNPVAEHDAATSTASV